MSEMIHSSTTAVTVEVLTKPAINNLRHPNDVDFEVKYSEGYTGPRLMPEGVVVVSKEAAEKFTQLGIGKVVQIGVIKEAGEDASSGDDGAGIKAIEQMNKAELQAALSEKGIEFKPSMTKPELIQLLQESQAAE